MAYSPDLMFEHGIDAKKGWFDMASLDYAAKLAPAVTFDVPRGRVVHVNADNEFEMGAHVTAPAIFLLNGELDFDVSNPGTTAGGLFMHRAIAPTGTMSGLVALGGYEIDSTEVDASQDYAPGELLTAGNSNTVLATGGVLTNVGTGAGSRVQQYVDPVVGIVSSGKHTNHNSVTTLSFWSAWLPGAFV